MGGDYYPQYMLSSVFFNDPQGFPTEARMMTMLIFGPSKWDWGAGSLPIEQNILRI